MVQKTVQRPIRNLLIAQFFGAFNDNAWKLTVTFLMIRALRAFFTGIPDEFEMATQVQTTIAFSVLTIPLMLFALPAGVLADRISKRVMIINMKVLELVLMLSATLCLWIAPNSVVLPLVVLGFMGAQSALFSPAKFGILPEILRHERLSQGNALLEMWTFLAIILGTAMGGLLLDASGNSSWLVPLMLTGLSVIGLVASLGIPRVQVAYKGGSMFSTVSMGWKAIRSDRILWLAVLGGILYWFIASLLGQDILVYAKSVLRLSDTDSGIPLALFGIGVGAGSLWAAKLSAGKVEYGLIPLGAVGMSASCLFLGILAPGTSGLLLFMFLMGVSSGFVIVPLQALVQWRSPAECRGSVIALSNMLTYAGIFAGSLSVSFLAQHGLSAAEIVTAASVLLMAGTVWAIWLVPDGLIRLGLILFTNTFYRLKVEGRSNVPQKGGVLLVPNHVSFVDGLMVIASVDRPVRFLIDQKYFSKWYHRPFMKALGAIPISSEGGPRMILRALRRAGEHLDKGEVVCIFPEGQLTRTGGLLPFRRGMELIVKNRAARIVPVYLDRLWGSIFSREGGRFLWKVPKRIPYPVTVMFGSSLPTDTPIREVREKVQELGANAWELRRDEAKPLHHEFVRIARRRPLGLSFADGTKPYVSRAVALIGAVALARRLRRHWHNQTRVGILLPPSVGGALANLAASISGRVVVNLNYTVGPAVMASAIQQAELKTILTSKLFLEKTGVELPRDVKVILIEELATSISLVSKLTSAVGAFLLPVRWLESFCGAHSHPERDDLATIIFSSGSTGEPKGVMLSHYNIYSNAEALSQVLRASRSDRILGILPFFHSFGYTTFWFATTQGIGMPLHPNPLDAASVGGLVQQYRVTFLMATPTFLQIYLRRVPPEQFGSLRLVLTGAEKLPERLINSFEDRFGIKPVEGYGATECSPVIASSIPDFRAPGYFQAGSRQGYVGHPLPGVSAQVVDPDTFAPVPPDTAGMLLVKGPNVMLGYLGRPDLTEQAIRDGWYVTGDIAQIEEDGFIKITDRLARFSKIGGEMVPHGKVEEALHEAAGSEEQRFAVTAVPDEKKGEKLVVIHTFDDQRIPEVIDKISAMGLPNLYIPRTDHFVKVDEIPILGSGKLDLKKVKKIAKERFCF